MIDPYLQRLLVMEQRRTCIVPMIKAPKIERQVRLTTMQLKKNLKKEKSKFLATITSSKEDNDTKKSLTPVHKEGSKREQYSNPKKPARCLPH